MSKVDVDLGDLLAKVLPTDVKVTIRHISSTPTTSTALFAPSPGEKSEPSFCETHFLSASVVPTDRDDGAEIIVFGIEVLVYTTAHLTTIFISKADSTGHLHLLKTAQKTSVLRRISDTFLFFLVRTHQRPGVRLVVSLFARAQNQYLFPGSIENTGKHVLDDRGLIKWWCRALDPILREYEPESGSQEQKKVEESSKSSATAYLIVPGCDKFETRGFFPSSAKSDDKDWPRWLNAYPLRQLCMNPDAPPRCLVPRFPDDPKTRFLIDLDDELPESRGAVGSGQWRSVKSLDQFWEMMSFRQECSAGRLVGFLWLVINPPGVVNSNPMLSSNPGLAEVKGASKSEAQAASAPAGSGDAQTLKTSEKSNVTSILQSTDQSVSQSANDGSAFYWPQTGRGHAVLSEEDYKAANNFLLSQDFHNEEVSLASTKAYNDKVAALADELWIGQHVVGKYTAEQLTDSTQTPNTLANTVLARKRKKGQGKASVENVIFSSHTPMITLRLFSDPLALGSATHGGFQWSVALGWVGLIWYSVVTTVCALGYYQLWKHCLRRPPKSYSATASDPPHVTVIRPIKGLEPNLYDCLASIFRQEYPRDKITVCLCVSSRSDPANATLDQLTADFPHVDARIYVEDEDPLLQPDYRPAYDLGPNPKIRNMSRAYREAKGDIVWIADCNVWVGKGVCGRMVDKLCGLGMGSSKDYKFVHHLPVAVDVTDAANSSEQRVLKTSGVEENDVNDQLGPLAIGGARLEELFLSSSHAKMYTAINTVLIAPCIVGKSNMFRRSHLDYLTTPAPTDTRRRNAGIDFFSDNICEDHLIGDLLWKNKVREEKVLGRRIGKHGLVFGDLAFQPIANMSVRSYMARRVRWLRVRKYIVMLATLVEPGTESILCSLYGAWGVTTALPWYLQQRGFQPTVDLSTWTAFFTFFGLSILTWILIDWSVYIMLHSGKTVELDENTPDFVRPSQATTRRKFRDWLFAWLGRETLAFPIWFWAIWGGETVTWRNRQFRVGLDTKAHEIEQPVQTEGSYSEATALLSKRRQKN
ncbi:histone acetylation protein-domain-containing protein [Aspergillus californicus]